MSSQPGASSRYDLAYIDANNTQYQAYYEAVLPLMRQGGVIVFDNVLWKGRVAGGDMSDPSSVCLRELNAALRHDPRVENTIVSLGDGLSLSVVK
jgi:predicted O-methyltransferase YrrM